MSKKPNKNAWTRFIFRSFTAVGFAFFGVLTALSALNQENRIIEAFAFLASIFPIIYAVRTQNSFELKARI